MLHLRRRTGRAGQRSGRAQVAAQGLEPTKNLCESFPHISLPLPAQDQEHESSGDNMSTGEENQWTDAISLGRPSRSAR